MTFYADLPTHQMISAVDAIIADQTAIIEQLSAAPVMTYAELVSAGYTLFQKHKKQVIMITFWPDMSVDTSIAGQEMRMRPVSEKDVQQVFDAVSTKFPALGTGIVVSCRNIENLLNVTILPAAYPTVKELVNAILSLAEMSHEMIQVLINKRIVACSNFSATACSALLANISEVLESSIQGVFLFKFKTTDKVIHATNHIGFNAVAEIIEKELRRVLIRAVRDEAPYAISNASVVEEVARLDKIYKARQRVAQARNRLIRELHLRNAPIPEQYHEEMEIALQR